jgi:glycosyltransferase involved in cell wall biosynthesis
VKPGRAKLLVFGPFQPPEVACGISSAVRAFAGSRVREAFDVELVSTFRPHRERRLPERLAYGVWLLARSALRVRRSRAALADVHAVSDRSLLSHAAVLFGARLAGRPALLRIHGGDFDRVFEQASGLHRRLIRFILRAATRVVVLSELWRSRVLAIEPRAAVEVVPNCADCRSLAELSNRPARACRRILFLANFCERKGHFDALEALARLVPRFPDVVLALGGEDRDPGTRARLEREAERLGVRRNLEFLGIVSGAAKAQALQDADILILPSHTENMPVSVIEGMAAGLPVVASRVGAVGEMLRDGDTGFVIEARDVEALAERLGRLLADPELARRLGRSALRHAGATWDADVVAAQNLALYARVA